jgi:hypothetical protein
MEQKLDEKEEDLPGKKAELKGRRHNSEGNKAE